MDTQQALDILGLSANPSLAEVKKAYREQVKLWHPDRYSNGSAMKNLAEKNIQDANLAYAWLKRRIPPSSPGTAARASRAPRRSARRPSPCLRSRLRDRLAQFLTRLNHRFPHIELRPFLEWLRHDPRNRYQPWYRYPEASGADERQNGGESFDQALQQALRNPSAIKRLHRMPRTSPRAGEDAVTPVDSVAKPGKPPHSL